MGNNNFRYLGERQPEKEVTKKIYNDKREETKVKRYPVRIQQSSSPKKKVNQRRRFDWDFGYILSSVSYLSGPGQK